MSEMSLIRHLSIFDPVKHALPVTIIGAGATGSRVFEALVCLGVTDINVCDFDEVEAHNLPNQLFEKDDIGELKINGLQEWHKRKTGDYPADSMQFFPAKIEASNQREWMQGVVFLLTDTMESRHQIFENCLKDNPAVFHTIETRMASSYGNIFNFNPNDPVQSAKWVDTLTDDEEAEVSACGSSISVGPTASIIANWAVWQYILFCREEPVDERLNLNMQLAMLGAEKL